MYINEESYKKHLRNHIGEDTSRRALYNLDIEDGFLMPESDLTEYEAKQQWETFNRLLDEVEKESDEGSMPIRKTCCKGCTTLLNTPR